MRSWSVAKNEPVTYMHLLKKKDTRGLRRSAKEKQPLLRYLRYTNAGNLQEQELPDALNWTFKQTLEKYDTGK